MKYLQIIFRLLIRFAISYFAIKKVKLNKKEIDEALKKYFPAYGDGMKRLVLDNTYWTCSQAKFERILAWDWTNTKQYTKDQFDCDDYAFLMKANATYFYGINSVGLVIDNSGKHAYNIIVFSDKTAKIFEPQSDKWIEPGEGLYLMEEGTIIL